MTRVRSLHILVAMAVTAVMACQSASTTGAKLRNQEGNYELAIKLAKESLAKNPKDAEAHFQMGVSYSYLDSVGLAYKHFMTAKKLEPEKAADVDNNIQSNFAKHYKLGQSSFHRQDVKTAAEEFELATQANPTQAVAYYNLAVAYQRLALSDSTLHEKALAAADRVLELTNPTEANYAKALQVTGRELVILGREDEAPKRFKRLIEEDPASFRVMEEIGTEELDRRDFKAAAVFLEMAAEARAKVGAEDARVYYNLGVSLYNLRNQDPAHIDEAINYYQKALNLTPDDPDTVFNIVVAHAYKKDWSNAAEWGEKYVLINPGDANGWKLLARSYTEKGDEDKAKEASDRFEALNQQ